MDTTAEQLDPQAEVEHLRQRVAELEEALHVARDAVTSLWQHSFEPVAV